MKRRTAGLVATLGLLACESPHFALEDLPETPIAMLYVTVQEGERILDAAEQKSRARNRPEAGTFEVEIERLEQYAGLRTSEDLRRDTVGRLSFFVAPRAELEMLGFRRGFRPLQWSPDRDRLMLTGPAIGERLQIFEWVASSGELRQLTREPSNHTDACYGPAGAFAFVRIDNARPPFASRIWVERPGEAARAVTAGPQNWQPIWSPDGTRLVYAVGASEHEVLHWLDPETGEGGRLGPGRGPVFTPDGQWIVYSAPTPDGWKLWRMRPDGTGKRGFGKSAFDETHPAISPDGRFVVFEASRGVTRRLLVRPLDGSPDRLLPLSGSATRPVW